ncbi:MAG: FAD-binding protein, partial [Patescibacteria group bacterium]
MYDLIIIGGGPAGITAGIYASRKKLNTLIIAKDFFGQISKTGQVDNWPGDMAI